MDSVCWKCKQACICKPATESDISDLIFFEKSQNALSKIMILMTKMMIHPIMSAFVHLNFLILFNIFYKWQHHFASWVHNRISLIGFTIPSLMNNISIKNIILVSSYLCFMNFLWWKFLCAHFVWYFLASENVSSIWWCVGVWFMGHFECYDGPLDKKG